VDRAGLFRRLPRLDDVRLGGGIFCREVLKLLVDKGLLSDYGLHANVHRGKVRKANRVPAVLGLIEEGLPPRPFKGWAEMIRKFSDVDPLVCPRCGGRMKVVAFMTEPAVVDRIFRHPS